MSTLTCPKCGSEMRGYERNRVHVDQCTGCGGLFLDRGELEALVSAAAAYYAGPPTPPQPQRTAQQTAYGEGPYGQPAAQSYGHAPRYSSSDRGAHGQPGHRRRKSFLGELFD